MAKPFLLRYAKTCISPERATKDPNYQYDEAIDMVRWLGDPDCPPVIKAYGTAPKWYAPNPKDVIAKAIISANHCLAIEGDKRNITSISDGLRTTLIIAIRRNKGINSRGSC